MNIKAMLDYQNLDREIKRLNSEFMQNEATVSYNKYNKLYQQAIEDGKRLSLSVGACFENFDRLTKQYEKLIADIDEYKKGVENISDIKQAEYFEKKLSELYSALEGIEKEIDNVRKELNNYEGDAKAFFANVNLYYGNRKKCEPAMLKVREEIQTKAKEVMVKQKAIEKEIEPELLEKYKRAKEVAKFPPLVPYTQETSSCGGCGLELSQDLKDKFKQDEALEFCPNCNRLVYKVKG